MSGTTLTERSAARRALTRLGRVLRIRSARANRAIRSWTAVLTGTRPPPMSIRAGRHLTDGRARNLPIIVIVAEGLGEGDAEKLAGQLENIQLSTRSFRPLFMIDNADFAPFRQRGYVVERVMPAAELAAVNLGDDHGEYVRSRIAAISRSYGAAAVVPIPAAGPDDVRNPLVRLAEVITAETAAAGNP